MVLTDCTKRRVGRVIPASRLRASTVLNSYTLTVDESSFTTYAAFIDGWKALCKPSRERGGGGQRETSWEDKREVAWGDMMMTGGA